MDTALPKHTLHSFDEFTRLRSIIIGSAEGANHPEFDKSFEHFFQPPLDSELRASSVGSIPRVVIDEVEEDIEEFIHVLQANDVEVHRPDPFSSSVEIQTPYWKTSQLYSLMPRDCLLVVGDLIIEVPSPMRARYFETFAFRRLINSFEAMGAHVVAAPKPMIMDDAQFPDGSSSIGEGEIYFDAANCVRLGRDIFIDVNRTANMKAVKWLQRTLSGLVHSDLRVHPMSLGNDHVDVTLIPLRPGVLLVDPTKVTEKTIPEQFKNWTRVVVEEVMPKRDYGLTYPLASNDGIGRNVLVLGDGIIIADDIQIPLIKALERLNFEVIPLQYRHGRTLGGSWHCITLDTCRDGGFESWLENYATAKRGEQAYDRYAAIFRDNTIDDACGIDMAETQSLTANDPFFLAGQSPSADLLSGLNSEEIKLDKDVIVGYHAVIEKALHAEYDAELFCQELERRVRDGRLCLSKEFLEFESLWRRDELDHTVGFAQIYAKLYDHDEEGVFQSLRTRSGQFDRLNQFMEEEFTICLLLAYDELVTTMSYTLDWKEFYPQFQSERLMAWIKRIAADEARHYRNLVKVLQTVHSDRLETAPRILREILSLDLQRNEYSGTFVLDHDDVSIFSTEQLTACCERLCDHLLCGSGTRI